MLKSAVVAMTILGCDCDQKTCEYVRTAELSLASIADRRANMRAQVARTNASYPLVVAICESMPQQPVARNLADAGRVARWSAHQRNLSSAQSL